MADNDQSVGEAAFRANKRRKMFRKRKDTDAADDEATQDAPSTTDRARDSIDVGSQSPQPNLLTQRRPAVRKFGIGFTSSSRPQTQELEDNNEERAVIPMHPSREQNLVQTDRFIKPTGKVAVVDDRHMMAFVDSKMAEMRSATPTAAKPTLDDIQTDEIVRVPGRLPEQSKGPAGSNQQGTPTGEATSNTSNSTMRQHAKPRRPRPTRDVSDIARDSLVDQIMRESAVPLYDRSILATPHYAASGVDNDAAAAEAFKEQFLAELDEQKRRKPPAPPAGAKGAAPASNGPKLGGSRAQRERMKAAEAAKGVKK